MEHDAEELWVSEARRRYQAYFEGDIEAQLGDEVMTRVRNQRE